LRSKIQNNWSKIENVKLAWLTIDSATSSNL
jgi:hypothetical protein